MKRVIAAILFVIVAMVVRAQAFGEVLTLTGDERPVVGNPISIVSVDDLSQYTFQWIRGDALGTFDDSTVLSATKDYIISSDDYEHWLRVTVRDEDGNAVFSKDTWISKLPVLYIDTEDGKPIISKTNYVTANLRIQGNSEYEQQYLDTTEIRGRGATSWAVYPQRPYKLKLGKKTKLFGFGKNKHWVLIPNYQDKSCLRNYTASRLAKQLGILGMDMTWVDVVLNGEVKGCYMLSQHVRVDKNSVDIFDWEKEAEEVADTLYNMVKDVDGLEETDKKQLEKKMEQNLAWISDGLVAFKGKTYNLADYGLKKEYDISQGYLFESTYKSDGITQFTTPGDVHFEVASPEHLATNSEMLSYVTNLWKDFEAEYCRNPTIAEKDFSKYADTQSMAAVWLVNEIMGQADGTNSRFSYIGSDRKIHFGPAWDFDHGSGSWLIPGLKDIFYSFVYEWAYPYYKKWYPDPWLCQMTFDAYWDVARPFMMDFLSDGGEMDAKYAYFAEAGKTNDLLWDGYSYDSKTPCTTAEDIENLRNFLLGHIAWLDRCFTSVKTLIHYMNSLCPYSCDPELADGITETEGKSKADTRKVLQGRHLLIIRNGKTYSVDGKCLQGGERQALQ